MGLAISDERRHWIGSVFVMRRGIKFFSHCYLHLGDNAAGRRPVPSLRTPVYWEPGLAESEAFR